MKYVDYEAVTDRADEAANATATWEARDLRVMIFADTDSPNPLAAVAFQAVNLSRMMTTSETVCTAS